MPRHSSTRCFNPNMITVNWNPSPKELRHWTVVTTCALAVMGSLFHFVDWGIFRVGHGMAPIMWTFGAFALVTAGTGTKIGLPAYWAWMSFVFIVGTVVGTVALGIVYYLVMTPMALVARACGRDRLDVRSAAGHTRWHPLPRNTPHDPARQF